MRVATERVSELQSEVACLEVAPVLPPFPRPPSCRSIQHQHTSKAAFAARVDAESTTPQHPEWFLSTCYPIQDESHTPGYNPGLIEQGRVVASKINAAELRGASSLTCNNSSRIEVADGRVFGWGRSWAAEQPPQGRLRSDIQPP